MQLKLMILIICLLISGCAKEYVCSDKIIVQDSSLCPVVEERKNCQELGGELCKSADKCALEWLDSTESYCCPIKCNTCTQEELEKCPPKECYKVACNKDTDLKCIYKEEWCAGVEKVDKPIIKLFVMAHDPPDLTNRYFTHRSEILALLGDKIEFGINYVIYDEMRGRDATRYCFESEGKKYCSLHEIKELEEDIRQICIREIYPKKHFNYVKNFNDALKVEGCAQCSNAPETIVWEDVAKSVGLNPVDIANCADTHKFEFLEKELTINEAYDSKGSPSLFVNGQRFTGGTINDFKDMVCFMFKNPPLECDTVLEEIPSSASSGGAATVG